MAGFVKFGHIAKPGAGINASISSFASKDVAKVNEFAASSQSHTMVDFFMDLIPKTAFSPFVEGKYFASFADCDFVRRGIDPRA